MTYEQFTKAHKIYDEAVLLLTLKKNLDASRIKKITIEGYQMSISDEMKKAIENSIDRRMDDILNEVKEL